MTWKPGPRPAATGAVQLRTPEVRRLRTVSEFDNAVRVLCEAFNADSAVDLVNTSVMVALEMSDNYVAGVFLGDEMAGAAVGWRGRDAKLHSHIAGIRPKNQSSGLGYLLKMHERSWARDRGMRVVEWTFDPLVRRNAHFNICKFNTRVLQYLKKHYGELTDGLSIDDDTDRLLVEWDLTAAHRPAAPGRECGTDLVGPVSLNPQTWDFQAFPDATVASADDSIRLVLTPQDIQSLRLRRPEQVAQWRQAVRRGLVSALDSGFEVTGFTADGCYVLRRAADGPLSTR